ncbi:E3 ubiquitin-protein ligase TRIP12 protein [Dioscorea alata]|uniref:E3 ubiquitin-protein ligase TRIP12 protein n=1 Tax=Dioscorea alata TaxID=55571 RepID=A0ACB7U945_DIOAL|nr:E3 ubiquitin-protein ligase TRIP12 protein [Dioscorea alata]
MDRGRKRAEAGDHLPADKRPCSSSDFHPGTSSSEPPADCDMEQDPSTSGSDEDDDHGGYGSDDDPNYASRNAENRTRLEGIVPRLGDADFGAVLAVLTELCEVLSFCMEDTLSRPAMEGLVAALVRLAGTEAYPDVMLLSIRALTYLCDIMPRAVDVVVRHEALPVLCGRLMVIEYLDVAEQCLQVLEKISKRQPVACLQAGVVMAVLNYVDFFSTTIKRVALTTVANVCKKLSVERSSSVMDAVPILCNFLQYDDDHKLIETAATCLIKITECFSKSPALLDELCKRGIINQCLKLVALDGRMTLGQSTYNGLIGLLTKLTANSMVAFKTLFELNIGGILRGVLLTMSDLSHSTSSNLFLEDGQPNQVYEIFNFLNQLIPPAARENDEVQLVLTKGNFLTEKPDFLYQFSRDILPVSVQVVNSGANLYVCYGCVSVINNIFYFSSSDILPDLIENTNISSFLAGLLARKDHHVLFMTLKIIETLMEKLPGVFSSSFVKEGVIYAIDALLNPKDGLVQDSSHPQSSNCQVTASDGSVCLCYAFMSRKAPSSEAKTCTLGKEAVLSLAKHIKFTHFISDSVDSEMALTEILQKLKTFCAILNDNVDRLSTNDDFSQNEEHLARVLDQVMRELDGGEGMSTFEFIESGIIRSLVHYLSNGRHPLGGQCSRGVSNDFLIVLKRFQTFSYISLSKAGQSWKDMLLTLLVRKLQRALSSVDSFPVITSHNYKPRYFYTHIPVEKSTMNPCVKVSFVREEGEENLSEYNRVLSVELSTRLDIIEEFLWPKVCVKKNECHDAQGEPIEKGDALSRNNSDIDQPQEMNDNTVQEPQKAFSTILRDLTERKYQLPLSEDASSKPKDLTTSVEGPAGGKISSSSPVSSNAKPKLIFSLAGKEIDHSANLYQAILQGLNSTELNITIGPKFWSEVYKVSYRRSIEHKIQDSQSSHCASQSSILEDEHGLFWRKLPAFSNLLLSELHCEIDNPSPLCDILFLLKILERLNQFLFHIVSYERINGFAEGGLQNLDDLKVSVSPIPQIEFISSKLTDKLEQQMRDPLMLGIGSMPSWCGHLMAACPFLFTFEARRKYFRLTVFGSLRNQQNQIHHPHDGGIDSSNNRRSHPAMANRKKFKADRKNVLESAAKMMALHCRSKAVLEVEFNDEVGTGLGPSMEFYTLVSHEFQKIGLGMWREDPSSFSGQLHCDTTVANNGFVFAPFGLFPRPWTADASSSSKIQFSDVLKKFMLLGQIVAKSIRDGRILDLPFSRAFYKIMLEKELSMYDIQSFDPGLGKNLLEFQALVCRKKFLESSGGKSTFASEADLCFRNMKIEDLCLDFTLPGYSDYVLTSGNDLKMVNINNLETYVSLIVKATVGAGIAQQVEAFKSGFNEVFPLEALQILLKMSWNFYSVGSGKHGI